MYQIQSFSKMTTEDELTRKENQLLEIQSRIGYIDGNIDQVWFCSTK